MEEGEQQPDMLHSCPKLPLWIIEYVWAHKMMDIQEVVDVSHWPEVDSQPLSLEDSWRLRVVSAQVYSIMKNRDMEHFERVMGFLEATYRLLPRLVAPIKHMKIIFGLKTMVIMWMLREGRRMADTVFKIIQFFPSKLPQYQDQCSQHEMFLMRKNHLDFKALAQTLAVDKDKLEDYIKNQMEEQYGEHYAQKVEDRLLHYLQELETVLPRDTYIDKILKKESPVTEEEKLLLEVITSDTTTIATTLQKLLHCDVASCCPISASQKSEHEAEMENSQLPKSVLYASSSKALLRSQVIRGKEAALSKDNYFMLEDESNLSALTVGNGSDGGVKNVASVLEREEGNTSEEEISQRSSECSQEVVSSPQFCSKHRRWVKSILRQCPDECSEELLLQANVSLSPPLFQSSSSTSSSQDLTPSDLIPCPPNQQHPPSQTSTHLLTAAQASEQGNPEGKMSSGPSTSANSSPQMEPLPQPSSSKDTLLPALLSPVVRLIDIATVRGILPNFKPHEASPSHFTMSSKKQAASTSSPQVLTFSHYLTSGNKESTFDQPETVAPTNPPNTMHKVKTAPVSQDASTSCQPPNQKSFSRLSRKFRQACTASRHSQLLDRFSQNPLAEQFRKAPAIFQSCPLLPDDNVSRPPTRHASSCAAQSGTVSSICTASQIPLTTSSSRQVVHQNSIKPRPQTHSTSPLQLKTLPCTTVVSCTSNSDCLAAKSETSRVSRAQLKLSLQSQAVLLQSKLLQPYVSLTRLRVQECHQLTEGRSSIRHVLSVEQAGNSDYSEERRRRREEEEDADSSFDLNTLYSSHSSSSDIEDSPDSDPDYKPRIKKKRLLLEYVTAVSLNNT
ncbi:nuclear factor of activated T-cells 5 [Thunnus thynnus]|uniref:nuclear factor of activated T-cells 5 n=1 Tax=Thunnus thynnus TaxID=8237 RepID=UPI0035292122